MPSSELRNRPKFSPEGYKDPACSVLFLVHLFAVLGFVGYVSGTGGVTHAMTVLNEASASEESAVAAFVQTHVSVPSKSRAVPATSAQLSRAASIGALSICLAIGAASVFLGLLRLFPVGMVYCSLYFAVGIFVALGVLSILSSPIAGLMCFAFAAILLCVLFASGRQIEFTAKCLKFVSMVYSVERSIFLVAVGVIAFQALWQVVSVLCLLPIAAWTYEANEAAEKAKLAGDEPPSNPYAAASIAVLFSFYWGSQVLANILHVTCAGVIGRWCFAGSEGSDTVRSAVPKAFGQALTSYLGPISFGSLLIAIVHTLKHIAESQRRNRDGNRRGNGGQQLLAVIAVCVLNCVERLLEIFNTFAFVIVAIYGLDYLSAGAETKKLLFGGHGLDILQSYNFAGIVCFVSALVGSVLVSGVVAGMAYTAALPAGWIAIMGFLSFLTTLSIMSVASRLIESGADTLFVCFAEEPEKLKNGDSEIYDCLQEYKRLG